MHSLGCILPVNGMAVEYMRWSALFHTWLAASAAWSIGEANYWLIRQRRTEHSSRDSMRIHRACESIKNI